MPRSKKVSLEQLKPELSTVNMESSPSPVNKEPTIIESMLETSNKTRKKSGPKTLSTWNTYLKDKFQDPEIKKLLPKDRMKKVAELWRESKDQ